VRRLAFAVRRSERSAARSADLGLYVSIFGVPGRYGLAMRASCTACQAEPAAVFQRARDRQAVAQFFLHRAGRAAHQFDTGDPASSRRSLASVFADVGWHVPDLLRQLRGGRLYFDSVSRSSSTAGRPGGSRSPADGGLRGRPGGNGTGPPWSRPTCWPAS